MYLTLTFVILALSTFPVAAGQSHYIFSFFKGNGEDGLHLAHSTDGISWTAINQDRSLLTPSIGKDRLMRDPSVAQGRDGQFHMVWTTGWHDQGIGVAHSTDLIHWSKQERIGVMDHERECLNCWAPEIFYDEVNDQFLIFWASTIKGEFPDTIGSCEGDSNHRMYYVTTKDFQSYSETKLLFDPGIAVIDSFLVKDGDRYVLVTKDETLNPEPKKNLFVATATKAEGPYKKIAEPFSPNWVEGPSVLKVGKRWLVYFDVYSRQQYRAMQTKDFKSWQELDQPMTYPKGMRHGTAFTVSQSVAEKLLQKVPQSPSLNGVSSEETDSAIK